MGVSEDIWSYGQKTHIFEPEDAYLIGIRPYIFRTVLIGVISVVVMVTYSSLTLGWI